MYIFCLWILFGIGAAVVAKNKGANGWKWFFLGLLLGPFGVLLAFFARGKQCPYCMSNIHKDAIICPKCQQKLDQYTGEVKYMKKLY